MASVKNVLISIHSPYTGRDADAPQTVYHIRNFNPLSLYRERRFAPIKNGTEEEFQSTLPIQGETVWKREY